MDIRDSIQHETDIEHLRRVALILESESRVLYRRISELHAELARATGDRQVQLELELQILKERIAKRDAELFGKKSERRGRPKGEGDAASPQSSEPEKKKGHGPTPQPNLPIEVKDHPMDEADRVCPECGHQMHPKGLYEESDEVDVIERVYRIVHHRREKCGCPNCGRIETALPPEKLIPGGRYSVNFAVDTAIDKYADHLPLERQVDRMARQGLQVTSQTLWDLLVVMYSLLLVTYLALKKYILTRPVIGADETTWRVMNKDGSKKWWIWAIRCEDAIFYMMLPSRSSEAGKTVLEDYNGIVITDGYSVYQALERAESSKVPSLPLPPSDSKNPPKKLPDYLRASCWAHARRYFFEAEANYPQAGRPLDLIAGLYAIEARAEEESQSAEDLLERRAELRRTLSRPIMDQIHAWLKSQRYLPKTQLGDAIEYMIHQWAGLSVFLDHPEVPIDNSWTERAMRGPVLGRRNHLGSRSVKGTEVSALFYTLIESAEANGLNPAEYLRVAIRRALANRGTVTLPHEYAAELRAQATNPDPNPAPRPAPS